MGLGLYGRAGSTATTWSAPGSASTCHVRFRARALRTGRALGVTATSTARDPRLDPRGSRPCSPATAPPPCSTPATSSLAEAAGCAGWPASPTSSRRTSAPSSLSPATSISRPRARPRRRARQRRRAEIQRRAGRRGAESAARRLGLDEALARRYVARLRDPHDGLVADGVVDRGRLETLVSLRTTCFPRPSAARRGRRDRRRRLVDGARRCRVTAPPAAAAHHAGQHPRPLRDAADAGRHRHQPGRPADPGRHRGGRLLPRLRARPTAVGLRLRPLRPGPHPADQPGGGRRCSAWPPR